VKSFRRWLYNGLATISLLLCVATVGLWLRSYWKFVDFGRISTSRTPTAYTQHLIRLGSINGKFLFTWRDIIWLWSNPGTTYVNQRWDSENGTYLRQEERFDPYRTFPKQSMGEQSWEVKFAGCQYKRLIEIANSRNIIDKTTLDPGLKGVVIIVPHAYVCAVTAILPLILISKWRKRQNAKRMGLCSHCGYDLRATPDRCPECGKVAEKVI
jgi:hypothetical protein